MNKWGKTIILCAILLFSYYKGINAWNINANNTNQIAIVDEINELENTESNSAKIYNKLEINELYASNAKSSSQERIKWSYRNETYYLLLPNVIDMENIKLEFSIHDDVLLSVYDSNNNLVKKVHSGEYIALKDGYYTFKLDTNVKKVSSYKVRVVHSNLPSIHIALNGGVSAWNKVNADPNHNYTATGIISVADKNKKLVTGNLTKFKGRGNATWKRDKKPYLIKFEEKTSIVGMNAAKTYILLANHIDGSLSRNYIWYNFARDLELEYTPETEPVDVYVNNTYIGSYLLTSKIEANSSRVDIDVENGDAIIEKDFHAESGRLSTNHGVKFYIEEPDLANMESSARNAKKQEITAFLNKIESLIFSGANTDELSKYLDYESFAKFYWVQEIALNYDGDRGSTYMYIKDGKLYAGPIWDMDTTMNRSYTFANTRGYYIIERASIAGKLSSSWYRVLAERKDFSDELDRIFIKYQDVITSLPDKISEYGERISISATMNYIRYPYSVMYSHQHRSWSSGNTSFKEAVNTLKNQTKTRINWYKNQYSEVMFDKLSYSVYFNDKELYSGDIKENKTITLRDEVASNCTIKIYGIRGEIKKEVKTYSLKDGYIDETLELAQRTSSTRKKYNRSYYDISFKLSGGTICKI